MPGSRSLQAAVDESNSMSDESATDPVAPCPLKNKWEVVEGPAPAEDPDPAPDRAPAPEPEEWQVFSDAHDQHPDGEDP